MTNKKVFIADDEDGIRNLYVQVVGASFPGVDIEQFTDGGALDQRLGTLTPDETSHLALVLTDNTMPKLKGLQILQKYARSDKLKQVPFIMTSGDGPAVQAQALEYGARDYVPKPVAMATLVAKLNPYLNPSK